MLEFENLDSLEGLEPILARPGACFFRTVKEAVFAEFLAMLVQALPTEWQEIFAAEGRMFRTAFPDLALVVHEGIETQSNGHVEHFAPRRDRSSVNPGAAEAVPVFPLGPNVHEMDWLRSPLDKRMAPVDPS